MSCVDINCPGRVHGHLPKYDVMWVVSGFEPHTCEISATLSDHPNLTSTLIARPLYDEIVRTKDMVARNIISTVQARWKTTIKYGKAWRAKQKALEERFGSFYDAYDNVVHQITTLSERNPGTHASLQLFKFPEEPNYTVFCRMFFSCNMHRVFQTLSSSALHRWDISHRKIQGTDTDRHWCGW